MSVGNYACFPLSMMHAVVLFYVKNISIQMTLRSKQNHKWCSCT